jgi:hypothetical protein
MSSGDRQESTPDRNPPGLLIVVRVFLILVVLPSVVLWLISLLAG